MKSIVVTNKTRRQGGEVHAYRMQILTLAGKLPVAEVRGETARRKVTLAEKGNSSKKNNIMKNQVCGTYIGLCFFFLTGVQLCFAQGDTWTQKANVEGPARSEGIGFSIGGKGYVGSGGEFPNLYNDFWEYDPTSNAWTQKANVPGPSRRLAFSFVIGSKGYVGAGGTNYFGAATNDFWEYDPATDIWTQKANFPYSNIATGFSIGSKGYAFIQDQLWEYDPIIDVWTRKADFIDTPRNSVVAFSTNGKGYIGLGTPASTPIFFNTFFEYDPIGDSWIQVASFPGNVALNLSQVAFSTTTKGYVLTKNNPAFWEFDPVTNAWSQKSSIGIGLARGNGVGFAIGSKGYIGTGFNNGNLTNEFWEYTPDVPVSQDFITQWDLSIAGSDPTQLSFGTATSGLVNYTWQELSPGSATGSGSWSGSTLTITGLPAGGTIRLQIAPSNFQRFIMNSGADRNRLIQVEQWGSTAWTSMTAAFYGCTNLQVTATDLPNLSGVTDMSSMFYGCTNLNSPSNINTWNTTSVTNMSGMFNGANFFDQDISGWNVINVVNMSYMFSDATKFNQDIGNWNVSNVTNMSYMFSTQASSMSFNQNIGNWVVSQVTDLSYMFYRSNSFNGTIGNWDVSNVANMQSMFEGAINFNQNIGNWNVGNVTNMSNMFAVTWSFDQDISNWNVQNVTDMSYMFEESAFNQNINNWNVSSVTNMQGMFAYTSFNQNIGLWNVSNVIDMQNMFLFSSFNQNIGTWNTSNVFYMNYMFYGAALFNQDISGWNVSNVGYTFNMFRNAISFNQDISSWDVSNVIWMYSMFEGASSFNQNLGGWNIGNVTDMSNMLNNSGLSITNYDATLVGWASQTLKPNVPLGAAGLSYCISIAARATLTGAPNNWSITGDIQSCSTGPTITSFTPASGPIGTTVTITGTKFSATPANNIVYFGATRATVMAATSTQLTVTVPTGVTYQPITVQVNNLTAYSSQPFVVTFAGGGTLDACSFAPKVLIGTLSPGDQHWPAIHDMDGDGKTDLIVPDFDNSRISVYRNISSGMINSGSFAPKVDFTSATQPNSVAVGDIDGDGKPDLAVGSFSGNVVSVFRNISTSGTIAFAAKVDLSVGSFLTDCRIHDIDGDGKPEILITSLSVGLRVLRNTSTVGVIDASSFAAAVTFTTGSNPFRFAVGDLDGDNKPEVAVPDSNTNSVSVLRNTSSSGTLSFAPQVILTTAAGTPPAGQGSIFSFIGDIDNDGKSDLSVINYTQDVASIFLNTSSPGTLAFAVPVDFAVSGISPSPALSDLNGDGKIDLTFGGSSSISVMRNNSTPGTVSFASKIDFNTTYTHAVGIADINGDGRNDLVTHLYDVAVLENVASTILPPTITSFTASSGPIGTSVTITGTNFSTPFTNTVEFNGVPATITASTATSLTVTVPVGATTGPIEVTIGCNTVTSASNFTVTIPTITITTQPADVVACVGASALFSVIATGTTNISYQWQFSPDGIVPFADIINGGGYTDATTATLSINTTGNFGEGHYRCRINGDFVTEVISNDEGLFISSPPTAPTTTGSNVCGMGSVTLSASGGTNGQYRWYTVASGGTAITGEVNDTYTTPIIAATTSYHVSIDDGTCESTRAEVIAQIIPLPVAPTTIGASDFPPAVLTLTASGGTDGQYRWYTTATGGTALAGEVNSSYTTPSISSTTTYYVSIDDGQCESTRTAVVAEIKANNAPVIQTTNARVPVEGKVTVSLTDLISDPEDNLDFSTLTIITLPISGASATIEPVNNLVLDYSGISFSGTDQLTIGICDQLAACSQQELSIEVFGDITVFNALSPNGDDKNPVFFLQNIDILHDTKENTVTIFNRWGDIVFEAKNYDNVSQVFRGLNKNGNELPSGTYYYRIEFNSGMPTKTGFLALKK